MISNFEKLRKKLHDSIAESGLYSDKTRKISERFDKLVNSYYKNEKQYHEEDVMYILYQKSINELRKKTKESEKFPSVEQWNKYAKEKDLLSSESLKYISGNTWHNLRNRTISEL